MTDSNTALSEVPALLEERRRYENWLAALDARRASTPDHVFERVHSDYRGRLQRVAEVLASHRHAIEEERANVATRRSLLEAEEGMRRDERAELELRAHVGELGQADAVSAFGAVDGAIEHLTTEKTKLAERIAELDEMLIDRPLPVEQAAQSGESALAEPPVEASSENGSPPAHPPADVAASSEGTGEDARPSGQYSRRPMTPSGSFDDLAFLSSLVESDNGGAKSQAAPAVASPPPASSPARVSAEVTRPQLETAAAPKPAAEEVPVPSPEPATPPEATHEPAPEPTPAAPAPDAGQRKSEPVLASTVAAAEAPEEEPLAMNVTGNRPIVLRTTITTEMSKTLKCNECSAMNYPTEWYCERCGAELAAL